MKVLVHWQSQHNDFRKHYFHYHWIKCFEMQSNWSCAVNEDHYSFCLNDSKWNVDSKSLNEKKISENNSK
jgi:hypothetical protein